MAKDSKEKDLAKALAEKEKEYDGLIKKHEEALDDIMKMTGEIKELENKLAGREARIEELSRELMAAEPGTGSVVADVDEPELTEADIELMEMACHAFGVEDRYLVKARIEVDPESGEKTAVVLTAGGARVRYRKGDEKADNFAPLNYVQVTGINPKAAKRKPITGIKK
ncbi:MAG: hypothetical protein SV375_00065 [Thermodesulfobacteriota bacterium]|nr:hypothetical protein [Thermodesulfobacteriota bacterium]